MRTKPQGLSIYFAGSIRGGRKDAELYARLIRYLGAFGSVLTAHVGDENLLLEEQSLSEPEIFERDMQWLQAADCVIAEVSSPSLGVGYEIGLAQTLDKKILCLYRPAHGKSLSAMIRGNPSLRVKNYLEIHEAENHINQWLSSL